MRRAVDLLAQLHGDVLAQAVEAMIDRMDAAEDTDGDEADHEGACDAGDDDVGHSVHGHGFGASDDDDTEHSLGWASVCQTGSLWGSPEGDDNADVEDDADREDNDPQGDQRHDPDLERDDDDRGACEDEPNFPSRPRGERVALLTGVLS